MLGDEVAGRIATAEAIDAGARAGEAGFQRQSGVEFADMKHCFEIVDGEAACAVFVSVKTCQARNERGQPADHADLAVARQHRRAFDRADEFHEARETAAHRVGGEIVAIGAMLAEP